MHHTYINKSILNGGQRSTFERTAVHLTVGDSGKQERIPDWLFIFNLYGERIAHLVCQTIHNRKNISQFARYKRQAFKATHIVSHIGIKAYVASIGNEFIIAANQIHRLDFTIDLRLYIKQNFAIIGYNIFGKVIAAAAWDNPYRDTAFGTVYHFKKGAVTATSKGNNLFLLCHSLCSQCIYIAFAIAYTGGGINMITACR